MALGSVLRIRQLLVTRSLWVDEAFLALNVVERDFRGLLEPLDGEQGAPVGYLWLLRGMAVGLGPTETWLRLPSLVAGILLLPAAWVLARRIFGERVALATVVLVATSPGLIRYSVELKQYALDALLAVGLVLGALMVEESRGRRAVAGLVAAGAVAIWFSHAAVVVLAGVGLHLLLDAVRRRDVAHTRAVLSAGIVWAAALGVLYLVSLRELTQNDFLTSYWQAGFPSDPLRPDRMIRWLWNSSADLLGTIGDFWLPHVGVATVVLAAGISIARGRGRHVALLLAFLPGLMLAASLEQYPFRGRLALFVVPFALMLLGSLLDQRSAAGTVAAAALLGVLAAGPVQTAIEETADPTLFAEARHVIEHVAGAREPHQGVLVHRVAKAPFDFYGARHSLEATGLTRWRLPDRCPEEPPPSLAAGESWVVFAYTHSARPPDEARIMLSQLDTMGRRLELVERHDAFAALYDFDAPPTDPDGSRRRTGPSTACLDVVSG
jgi:uncharacterized membrane protein